MAAFRARKEIRLLPACTEPFSAVEGAELVADDPVDVIRFLHVRDHIPDHSPVEPAPRHRLRTRSADAATGDHVHFHYLFGVAVAPPVGRVDLDAREKQFPRRSLDQATDDGIEEFEVVHPFIDPPLARIVAPVVHRPDVAGETHSRIGERLENRQRIARLVRRRRHDGRRRHRLAVNGEARHAADVHNRHLDRIRRRDCTCGQCSRNAFAKQLTNNRNQEGLSPFLAYGHVFHQILLESDLSPSP